VGAGIALAIAYYVAAASGFVIRLAPLYAGFILLGTIATCMGAGLLALRRVETADPAELM
jgi:ABC-type antimicrobial peptide transport system permease subunit